MALFQFRVDMKFSGLGGAWTDVTSDVLASDAHGPVVCEHGIRGAGPTDRVATPGFLEFTLDNSPNNSAGLAGYYSLYHTNKRSGFDFNIPVRLTVLTESGLSETTHFVGRLADIQVVPGSTNGSYVTKCRAVDPVATWAETYVTGVSIASFQRADQLIATLLTAADPDFGVLYGQGGDQGLTTFPWAFDSVQDERTTVLEELNRIVASEHGYLYFSPDPASPVITLDNRHRRFTYTEADEAAKARLTANGFQGLELPSSRDDLIQKVQVTAYPTVIDTGATTVLYSLGTTNTLVQPGETNTFLFGPFRDPNNPGERIGGKDFASVTATTDYTMNSAQDGSGSDLTANFSVSASTTGNGVRWTITNNGTTAGYITKLQLRGNGVYRRATVVEAVGATTYGTRTVAFSMPYQTDVDVARETAQLTAALYGSPLVTRARRVRFCANYDTLSQTHGRTGHIGLWISLTETQSGLTNADFVINGLRLECHAGGIMWVTWWLEPRTVLSWTTPSYAAGNFTANSSGWSVDAGDVTTYAYSILGKTMAVSWALGPTTVASSSGDELRIAIPASKTAAKFMLNPFHYLETTTRGTGFASVSSGGSTIVLKKSDASQWNATTNNTHVFGELIFEIQ